MVFEKVKVGMFLVGIIEGTLGWIELEMGATIFWIVVAKGRLLGVCW